MAILKESADKELAGLLDVTAAAAGMRTVAWLKTGTSDKAAAERASQLGLEVQALSSFALQQKQNPALILGFAGCNPDELRRGVSVLATALRGSPALR
jgi:GntR family transcriptional regulator / MocR family aminotransferase